MSIKNRLGFALEYTPRCDRLLDIGCDYGEFSAKYLKMAKSVYAVDPNKDTIKEARRRHKTIKNINFVAAPAEKLPFPNGYFDVVTITDAFEHVRDEKKTIKEIYRVLKPDGVMIFSVPYKGMFRFIDSFNMKFYFPKIYRWWKGKDYRADIYEDAPWHRHYSLNDLERFFKGKFVIEKKHRGGLFVWPIMWLASDAIYTKIFKKTPSMIQKTHDLISDVDYSIPYGSAAFHIVLRARKI
jgi:ubiquinone/menaquinone biosynthesis C-methylase UbiE